MDTTLFWIIGGTLAASPQVITDFKAQVDSFIPDARFMYGGSVTPDNIASLLSLNLHGVLVATASLDPSSFISITQTVSHVS